ncbi:Phosphopantetheinyl transferase [Ekhidna lutea]|uniref:Phosphopantetheinyl transferase n=1 Tax=Ekhidna lutea TaxID=447679 RepID=A0A239K8X9_EKHLU|nr:4'-phosphopantetheinyl transferase superfamily protein [Ekhidna lutea]SNT14916.1 Phosphopantetheinyl transferase [Ekhidna lutea]
MPLLLNKQIDDRSAYAVWNIQETFLELPYLSPEPFPAELAPVRQAEWIVGRILVKSLCEKFEIPYEGIAKQEKGKPYLIGNGAHISISHSFPIAAAMIHLDKPCGIDMERPRDKHEYVKMKYLHESEMQYKDDLKKLCTIWCAKEVIYKIFGRKFLSLKDEIKVTFESEEIIKGEILKKGHEDTHEIHYEWVKEYLLAFGI